MLLERGRLLLEAADKLVVDVDALAHGWEPYLTIECEVLITVSTLFLLVDKLVQKSETQFSLLTEVLVGV